MTLMRGCCPRCLSASCSRAASLPDSLLNDYTKVMSSRRLQVNGRRGWCGGTTATRKVQQWVSGSSLEVSTDSSTPLYRVTNGDSPCTYNEWSCCDRGCKLSMFYISTTYSLHRGMQGQRSQGWLGDSQ